MCVCVCARVVHAYQVSVIVNLFSRKSMPLKVRLRFGPRDQEKVNGDKKVEDVEVISEESDSQDAIDLPELPEGLLQSCSK